ncbi:UDP:flavonoid glycosyltransferase YjiC (YdhE family) [Corynebacterium afermentans]
MFRQLVTTAASILIVSNAALTLRLQSKGEKGRRLLPPMVTAVGLYLLAVRPRKLRVTVEKLAKLVRQCRKQSLGSATDVARSDTPQILFVTSNGAGLGHISRVSAIAAKLKNSEAITLTLSSAYRALMEINPNIHYFPSQTALGLPTETWGKLYSRQLSLFLEVIEPAAVVFDGTFIYEPLVQTCQRYDIPIIWLRRGCWRSEVARASAQLMRPEVYCDGVLVPGDYGDARVENGRAGVEVLTFPPVVMTAPEEQLERRMAQQELGLNPSAKHVLIQLGAGVINDATSMRSVAIEAVLAEGFNPVLVANPLDKRQLDADSAQVVRAFPMARYFRAFEFGILAAGYNSVQESIALSFPAVFVPNQFTQTDDQVRRAETIAALGVGLSAMDEIELRQSVSRLSDLGERERLTSKTRDMPPAIGAEAIAAWLDTSFGCTS